MAANTAPIFGKAPDVQWAQGVATAVTSMTDLTSGSLVFTADATNGGYVHRIRFRALGTNIATVARIWINNGSAIGTAANNTIIEEVTLPATTAAAASATQNSSVTLAVPLPAGYKIYVTLGTTVAAGYDITAFGSKY